MWRPQLIKDITLLERIQRRATKYILNDYTSTYKFRLEQLNLLPLMYIYEINDLMFLIKSLKSTLKLETILPLPVTLLDQGHITS